MSFSRYDEDGARTSHHTHCCIGSRRATHCATGDDIYIKLEALRERRPLWPRQIITPIFPNVIMLSLGGERLTPKVLDNYLYHDLGMLPLLFILEYPDNQNNLINSSLYYPGPIHKISSQSVHDFLSNVVHRQTNRQTNAIKNITSFAKEVVMSPNV